MSRRYLRLYHYDEDGDELTPPGLSTVLMPTVLVPSTRMPASAFVGGGHDTRQWAAAQILFTELKRVQLRRTKLAFHGVLLLCCPNPLASAKRHRGPGIVTPLTPTNSYIGSYAVLNPQSDVAVGNVLTRTIHEALRYVAKQVPIITGSSEDDVTRAPASDGSGRRRRS